MNNDNIIEINRIRKVWDEEQQKWFFSIVDVIEVLTEADNPRRYWSDLKRKLGAEGGQVYEKIVQLKMLAPDGKMRLTDVAATEQLFHLIRSVSSPKTEQFRSWLESIENKTTLPSIENKGEIIFFQPDSSVKLDVLFEDFTVWLTQAQMAELFQTTRPNITMHIRNIFDEGELKEISVSKDFLHTAVDGKRYATKLYNLDAVISVGYRVKSIRGVQFRQWASGVLKDYIMKGYVVNERFERIEGRVAETEKQIDFFVRTSLPPAEGVYYEGQIFTAYAFVSDLIESAKESIVLLDNYVDRSVLMLLSQRGPNVSAEIFTKNISPQLKRDIEKHNAEFDPINVHISEKFHDRFLIIDQTVYFFGSSIKDLGKKGSAFSKMEISKEKILDGL